MLLAGAAFRAAVRLLRVVAALLLAARRLGVVAAFLAAVRRFRVTAAFRAADVPIGQLRRFHESSGLANGSRFCCGAPLDSNTDGINLTAPSAASAC